MWFKTGLKMASKAGTLVFRIQNPPASWRGVVGSVEMIELML